MEESRAFNSASQVDGVNFAVDVSWKSGFAGQEFNEIGFTMGGALKTIRSVGGTMSKHDMAFDMMETIVAGATEGVWTEGATLGTGTTESGEDDVKVGTIPRIALKDPHTLAGDVHGGTASSATVASGVHTMRKFIGKISHVNVGTSVNVEPETTMRRREIRFV